MNILLTYNNIRSKMNFVTLLIAFVLSIMVIHTHNECESFPDNSTFVKASYGLSIGILTLICVLFATEIFSFLMKNKA